MIRETIALVSCVSKKVSGPCAAKDLYDSDLFEKSRAYAEQEADRWFILSAEHGLLDPEQQIVRYEKTLNNMPVAQRRKWARRVYGQMQEQGLLGDGVSFLWLAGRKYSEDLSKLLKAFPQHDPLEGLRLGERKQWLMARIERS